MKGTEVGGAIALAEGAVAHRVLIAVDGFEPADSNVFGDRVAIERGTDVAAMVERCGGAAGDGERVTLIARARDLAASRAQLARLAARRVGVVVHAIAEPARAEDLPSQSGAAPAYSLGDLPWGMLVASGAAEALDLALVARRAAEDSGCPFFVVHEPHRPGAPESFPPLTRELCEAFLGGARPQPPPGGDERAVAERVPFALASALRDLESITARRQDVLRRAPAADTSFALVGMGPLGAAMLAHTDRIRAAGHDVSVVRLIAWRPFPGPRLVKALLRAHAVSVLENVDNPLGGGGPLAVELKAAFADAITWAPGFPGVGRVPRFVSAVLAPTHDVQASDVDGLMDNMLADDRGKRTLVLGRRG